MTLEQLDVLADRIGSPHDRHDYDRDVIALLTEVHSLRNALEDVDNVARNRLVSSHLVPGTPEHADAKLADAVKVIEEIIEITARALP